MTPAAAYELLYSQCSSFFHSGNISEAESLTMAIPQLMGCSALVALKAYVCFKTCVGDEWTTIGNR